MTPTPTPTKPIPILLSPQEPVSHLVDPTGSNVLVTYPGFQWRQPGQNFGLSLVGHRIVIPHIVERIGVVKRVDVVVGVMLRHFCVSRVLKIV